ncbi:SIS domain-containing protein [Candidatus Woesearchaeota archaeon]|nr:SIS domain-containing protein [Candidatus Woesearchaeota archaeon]
MMKWSNYKDKVIGALNLFRFDEDILRILEDSIEKNQKIFVAGNGGSAAIALHYVCDFSKGANKDWSNNPNRMKAICLTSNIGYMTAIANDNYYSLIFKEQLVNLASPNDILILISSSGNSPNIIEAANYAKEHGLVVIGITGFSGGKLKEVADYSAHIEFDGYEVCEDVHSVFGHFLVTYLREHSKNS